MYIYIWCMLVFMSVVVLCGDLWNVCCVSVAVKDNGVLSIGVLKYIICLCNGCDGCYIFCLYCDAWSCRCSCMGSMPVSSCLCLVCIL